jgi:pyridoxamine 5'-phosphate oxidase
MAASDPIAKFHEWFAEARAAEPHDPTALALATSDANGQPGVRMVLLKHADDRGFVFYTNLQSPKSDALRANARAALCFHWPKLDRQVRIDGPVESVTDSEADAYFATRPRLSQLGAWASHQSYPMAGRFELEKAVAIAAARFALGTVPRPPHWSGWRVAPARIEFWQAKAFRHHDRQRFTREGTVWRDEWLFP